MSRCGTAAVSTSPCRAGSTRSGPVAPTGLPLLAPWANRCRGRRYRAAGVTVDLSGLRLGVDDNGLPIHGLLVGRPGWSVDRLATRGDTARRAGLDRRRCARLPVPAPHRGHGVVTDTQLRVDTTIVPTGRRPVPVAFGWHPYLRLPDAPRSRWRLRLPPRRHLALDDRGIPTGDAVPRVGGSPSDRSADLRRRLRPRARPQSRDRASDGRSVELRCGPATRSRRCGSRGKPFAALEPMAAPTNALVDRKAPVVERGDPFTATFTLTLDQPD